MQCMNSQRNSTKTATDSLRALVALGANLDSPAGAPTDTLIVVIEQLHSWSIGAFAASSVYRSSPENCPEGSPDFVNAVVSLQLPGDTEAEHFLDRLLALEQEYGRQRGEPANAPRPLDLDLIAFGEWQQVSDALTLPHPRFHQRRFVLEPLAELDPRLVLPPHRETVSQLLQPLLSEQRCTRVALP